MSSLVVKVTTIDEVHPHMNADRLALVTIGGWQCVVLKDAYVPGQRVIFFPPDTVLAQEWTDRFGVTQYCQALKGSDEGRCRIRQTRLRGEPSFGLVIACDELALDMPWDVDTDVAAYFGATKYEPPVKAVAGDAVPDYPLFVRYTDIEDLRNFPTLFRAGELVQATHKLHGTNSRAGVVGGELLAGSHGWRRQRPDEAGWARNTYWFPLSLGPVRTMVEALGALYHQVILFGEVYGQGVQKLDYGQRGLAYAAFDLVLDGRFVDAPTFGSLVDYYGVPRVPVADTWAWGVGLFPESDLKHVAGLASGKAHTGEHIREGVVLRPLVERTNPKVGRLILKYASDAYRLGNHDVAGDH